MDGDISQFVAITGADSDQARTFLEKAKGDVQNAIAEYYQAQEDAENPRSAAAAAPASEPSQPAPAGYTGPRTLSGAPAEIPSGWGSGANSGNNSGTSTPNSRSTSNQIRSTGSRGGMSSFRDIRERDAGGASSRGGGGPKIGRIQHNQDDDDDGDDDEEDDDERKGPANFYTGGERSGLSVQNPDRGRGRDEDQPEMVRQILEQAEAMGRRMAEEGTNSAFPSLPTIGNGSTNLGFSGRGRTIGDEASTDQPASASASNLRSNDRRMDQDQDDDDDDEEDQVPSEPVIRRITFWADGFSIGDGPLITSADPRHEEILKAINAKRAPLALLNVAFGQEVELRIEKRTTEKYRPPPPEPMKAFGGSGNRLGSPAPTLTSSTNNTGAAATSAASQSNAPVSDFKLDESQPVTQVQLRLGDGSRLVGRFNHTHTVADIRSHINSSNPDSAGRPYTLQSSFPPKPLTDESTTIKNAGLLNAVVIQKWV